MKTGAFVLVLALLVVCALSGANASSCQGWHQTSGCDPDGSLEPQYDQDCATTIQSIWSGYCECGVGQKVAKSGCKHEEFTCADKCASAYKAGSSGLSGGWTFIIIVFCFAFVYVVGGQLYLRYREEKTGVDACPNYEFWREIPSLVRDGCVFSYGKVVDLYKHYTDKSGAADDEDNYEQI